MLRSFEERERAEELLFVIGEERRFLNRRAGAHRSPNVPHMQLQALYEPALDAVLDPSLAELMKQLGSDQQQAQAG